MLLIVGAIWLVWMKRRAWSAPLPVDLVPRLTVYRESNVDRRTGVA